MSYDLYFRAPEGARRLSYEDFFDYFNRRDDFVVDGLVARYLDEATGVSFEFTFTGERQVERSGGPVDGEGDGSAASGGFSRGSDGGIGGGSDGGIGGASDGGTGGGSDDGTGGGTDGGIDGGTGLGDLVPVFFRLPFCRAHVFALEAEPVLSAFVDAFDLRVSDPQAGGMGEAEFTMACFLEAYDRGNRVAVRVLLDHVTDQAPHVLPERTVEWCWHWNRHRRLSEIARDRGRPYADRREGIFVPKIMFFEFMGEVLSAVVWPDGIPVSLPAVDVLILARDRLSPRRLGRRRADVCLVPYASARALIDTFPVVDRPLPHRLLAYGTPPEVVADFFRAQDRWEGELRGVTVDQILDAELVASVARR